MVRLPIEKIAQLERRFAEIEARMSAGPDSDTYVRLASEYAELQPIVSTIRTYQQTRAELSDIEQMLADRAIEPEMRELAESELPDIRKRLETAANMKSASCFCRGMRPIDRNAILEIRAGTGGDEAGALRRRSVPHV